MSDTPKASSSKETKKVEEAKKVEKTETTLQTSQFNSLKMIEGLTSTVEAINSHTTKVQLFWEGCPI